MLTENDTINGLPVRAEIRVPRTEGAVDTWLTSIVVCQDTNRDGMVLNRFVVWSIWQDGGRVHAENGIYDITEYSRALDLAMARVQGAL